MKEISIIKRLGNLSIKVGDNAKKIAQSFCRDHKIFDKKIEEDLLTSIKDLQKFALIS